MLYVIAYVLSIAGINWAFASLGANWLTNCVAGTVFIFRDAAQRKVGHWIIAAMVVAIIASYLLASPDIAFASAAAFAISEVIDWMVYSITKRDWADRMLLSSAVAAPIDSVVFLWLAGFLTAESAVTMTAAKIFVSGFLWLLLWLRVSAMSNAPDR